MLLQLQMEIKCSQKSGFSDDIILSLVPGKTEILATLIEYFQMFSSLIMEKKFNIADQYRLA